MHSFYVIQEELALKETALGAWALVAELSMYKLQFHLFLNGVHVQIA